MKFVCGLVENVCNNTSSFWDFRHLKVNCNLSVKHKLNCRRLFRKLPRNNRHPMVETSGRFFQWGCCKEMPKVVVRRCTVRKVFRKTLRNSQETTLAGDSDTVVFLWTLRNFSFFREHLRTAAFEYRDNKPRVFKTKCEKNESNDILMTYLCVLMASAYTWLNDSTSVHQTV